MSALNEPILKLMNRTYEPQRIVELTFGRYDLAFKTDPQGRPVLLFMGKKTRQQERSKESDLHAGWCRMMPVW